MTDDRERSAINVEKTKHMLFEELSRGKNSPFESMKDAVLAAACIGYENNSKIPLNNVKKIFEWDRFSPQTDIPFLRALALAETGDDTVLLKRDDVLTIVEEYANGGINDLYDEIIKKPGNALPNLVDLILEQSGSQPDDE
ncbi:MAG: hypothetical protein C4B59_01050 [Candidatus Methanogaster sp.]|uniref:Uncharacterized protein n=1 Tax=Candidatus Methanogaster sp. TaxID=3386292 RepID=A0AC61L625_9EURY|nr:MAG: hypothetical protein C4B59_01050 [ANME-2 cluster archaeon]